MADDGDSTAQASDPIMSAPLAAALYSPTDAQLDAAQNAQDYGYASAAPIAAALSAPSPGVNLTAAQDARQDMRDYGYQTDAPTGSFPMQDYLSRVRGLEGGAAGMSAKNGSAVGTYQFQAPTWQTVMKQNPNLGLTADGIYDPVQQEMAAQAMTTHNIQGLQNTLGRMPTPAETYIAHQQGLAGASALLQANPNALAASVVPAANIAGNGGNPRTLTVGGYLQQWQNNYNNATPRAAPLPMGYQAYANPMQAYTAPPQMQQLVIGGLNGNSNNPGFSQ